MATEEQKTEANAPPPKAKKKSKMLIVVLVVLIGLGGGLGWYFTSGSSSEETASGEGEGATTATEEKTEKPKSDKPPIFVGLEPFVVNLQSEGEDKYLQVGISLKVTDSSTEDAVKLHIPEIRNQILLLLSSKTASDLGQTKGKQKLSNEILKMANQIVFPSEQKKPEEQGTSENTEENPEAAAKAADQMINAVLFNSFIIQ